MVFHMDNVYTTTANDNLLFEPNDTIPYHTIPYLCCAFVVLSELGDEFVVFQLQVLHNALMRQLYFLQFNLGR